MISRRLLLTVPASLALVSCTGGSAPSVMVGEKDALLVDQSFIRIANLISITPGEPPSVVATAQKLTNGSTGPLDIVQAALQALIAGTPPPTTISTFGDALSQLDIALADLAPIAAAFNPEASTAIIAAEVLLATAETIANSQPTAKPAVRVAHASSTSMSVETARKTLNAYLGR